METILVVEDELSIRSFICINLRKKKYEVLEAENGEEALSIFNNRKIDIVLLDLMLPGIDGFEVCQKIRDISQSVGIIMLTARSQEEDRVKGLVEGADDYLLKPFSMVELEARIISLARRLNHIYSKKESLVIKSGPFELDVINKKVTPTEYCLLQFLINNKNKVFTRNDILDEVWGINYIGDEKVVDVNIRRIRRKIENDPSAPEYLCTDWGYGYLWKE
ncbi:response regulator transcription factor [Clostridium beijerinckii]|jgi:Response regulators consisting of a CheY-like receiver domain and a winged-helix DNA-binding domain|uniref:Stage 0 sporulation protein A homolog n=3 Tax=Clostridium beijerinckii TaxID=1520 RepID=A0AAE2UZD2_CLOBE|nr:response regulator transcription factor [Clostridium beijerinckii]ABR34641.1 two component transcriptional regulator, winged helix family [Clostridium beijerinckii NCIMB 8052]AIU03719.1 two component transcriptional regulator [Clostridium beijerinckii ATCC 35702]MBF7810730.1 response regulator transcription factor [Clostridium beijerinckii]NRT24014.1 DNA-binding response OmpR family regulator [Clostridium beijerinckii]NRT68403.1 DNA-binding response OmpR family regulator [Clostridium beijer